MVGLIIKEIIMLFGNKDKEIWSHGFIQGIEYSLSKFVNLTLYSKSDRINKKIEKIRYYISINDDVPVLMLKQLQKLVDSFIADVNNIINHFKKDEIDYYITNSINFDYDIITKKYEDIGNYYIDLLNSYIKDFEKCEYIKITK
jgi:hypothetical protein